MEHSKYFYDTQRNMPTKNELRYFKKDLSEFDSPDEIGSGLKNMNIDFVHRLDEARHLAGCPFRITSGFRTAAYHADLKKRGYHTAKYSAHLKGIAADISTPDSTTRYKILKALMEVGFTRFGIGEKFLHVDEKKTSTDCMWDYY